MVSSHWDKSSKKKKNPQLNYFDYLCLNAMMIEFELGIGFNLAYDFKWQILYGYSILIDLP